MSAFLGPIHYWLYNKIQLQQELTEEIILLSDKLNSEIDLRNELDNRYGISERRPLDEVIDKGNIHGWLQTCISQEEFKLAYCVTKLLEKGSSLINEMKLIYQNKGKVKSPSLAQSNADEIYKTINDCLLDGMPCDRVNTILRENEDKVIWKRNACVHKRYWDEVYGDINNYYFLRESFIKGLLMSTPYEYEKIDQVTGVIKRRDDE